MVQTVARAPEEGKLAGAGAAAGAHPVITAALQLMGGARVLEVTVAQAPGLTVAQAPRLTVAQAPRAMVTMTMMMLPVVLPQQEASHPERCPSQFVLLHDAMDRLYRHCCFYYHIPKTCIFLLSETWTYFVCFELGLVFFSYGYDMMPSGWFASE
jgi:hypothetical protein